MIRRNLFGIFISIFAILFVLTGIEVLVFADTNSVWHNASDVRGGVLGSDEGSPDFILNSTLSLRDSGKITDVPTPINGSDAVNKDYVDAQVGGRCEKGVCTWTRGIVCPSSWTKVGSGEYDIYGFRLDPNFNSSDDDKMGSFCCRNFISFPAEDGVCGSGKDTCIIGNIYNSSSNSTHHIWYCSGVNGGTNSSMCSKLIPSTPVNGICNNAVRNGCTSGTSNGGAYTDTPTHYRWRCDGLNGGNNSGMCSKAKLCGTCQGTCSSPSGVSCGTSIPAVSGTCSNTGNSCTRTCPGTGTKCSYSSYICDGSSCVPILCGTCVGTCDPPSSVSCGTSMPYVSGICSISGANCTKTCVGTGTNCLSGCCKSNSCTANTCSAPSCASKSGVLCGSPIPDPSGTYSCTGNSCTRSCPGTGTYCSSGTCVSGFCVVSPPPPPSCGTCWKNAGETCKSPSSVTCGTSPLGIVPGTCSGNGNSCDYICSGTGTYCSSGTCVGGSCPPTCTPSSWCDGDYAKSRDSSCSVTSTHCPYGCSSGSCDPAPPTCTPSSWCDGDYAKSRDSSCSETSTYCPHGCSSGSCDPAPPICTPSSWCDGDYAKSRDSSCSVTSTHCPYGCSSGSCDPAPPTCTPSSWCDGDYAKSRDSSCSETSTYCPHGCSSGSCDPAPPICTPSSWCDGDYAKSRDSSCSETSTYCPHGCSSGSCDPPPCDVIPSCGSSANTCSSGDHNYHPPDSCSEYEWSCRSVCGEVRCSAGKPCGTCGVSCPSNLACGKTVGYTGTCSHADSCESCSISCSGTYCSSGTCISGSCVVSPPPPPPPPPRCGNSFGSCISGTEIAGVSIPGDSWQCTNGFDVIICPCVLPIIC